MKHVFTFPITVGFFKVVSAPNISPSLTSKCFFSFT